jgi:hypothetical protein
MDVKLHAKKVDNPFVKMSLTAIVKIINDAVNASEYADKYHFDQKYELGYFNKIKKRTNERRTHLQYTVDFNMGKPFKTNQFTIRVRFVIKNYYRQKLPKDVTNNPEKMPVVLEYFKLTGTPLEQVIDYKSRCYPRLEDQFKESGVQVVKQGEELVFDNKAMDELYLEQQKKNFENTVSETNRCFNPSTNDILNYSNTSDCTSFHKNIDNYGVWDKPCINNEDCPYYKSNKNYPNELGGCMETGICEMPVGVRRIGYQKYDKNTTPFIYNCLKNPKIPKSKLRKNKCINNQKTPDFMFAGDIPLRKQNSKVLENKKLQVTTPF